MTTRIGLYVKRLRGKTLSGYMLREQNAKIELSLAIDDSVYEEVVGVVSETNYVSVDVTCGTVVGISPRDEKNDITIGEHILLLLSIHGRMSKKMLYELVRNTFPVSDKTLQREVRKLSEATLSFKSDYNNVWVINNVNQDS